MSNAELTCLDCSAPMLLCAECNMALGLLHDNPETIARLGDYVAQFATREVA